ncbi:MAG TPA: hypothetical protein PK509_02660 [Catalimonadaceae bacterium]|nr:hypothetical protein [Catalimonadaceae bacterium]
MQNHSRFNFFRTVYKRHFVLSGVLISALCFTIAVSVYPGGNPEDLHSDGFYWTKNYISHLLNYVALNGQANPSRPFAVAAVLLLGFCSGLAFLRFSNKIQRQDFKRPIRYLSVAIMLLSVLMVAPSIHDQIVRMMSITTLVLFFYNAVYFLKSGPITIKLISSFVVILFYGAGYMYFTRSGLTYLPMVQKLIHMIQIVWIIYLEYGIHSPDQPNKQTISG